MINAGTGLAEALRAWLDLGPQRDILWFRRQLAAQGLTVATLAGAKDVASAHTLQGRLLSPETRLAVAVAISRADNSPTPEGYGSDLDHPEISDWSAKLADAALSAALDAAEAA